MCLLRFLTSTIFAKVSEGSENDEPYLRFFIPKILKMWIIRMICTVVVTIDFENCLLRIGPQLSADRLSPDCEWVHSILCTGSHQPVYRVPGNEVFILTLSWTDRAVV